MNYKTYAEAKIANPDSEIVTTGKKWNGCGSFAGVFQKINDGGKCDIGDDSWVICNPADYCSSVKEFLEAGYSFSIGDLFLGTDGAVHDIGEIYQQTNQCEDSDSKRYILSASALDGGCKIPAKAEQWTVYNNTIPLCELEDEHVGKLVKHSGCVEHMNPNSGEWGATITPMWNRSGIYRIKPKSERELFIDKSVGLMTSETERTMEQMFGAQFDAGARYKDSTQHFGENI